MRVELNKEAIKEAIERLMNHGQYSLNEEDLKALNFLIEVAEEEVLNKK